MATAYAHKKLWAEVWPRPVKVVGWGWVGSWRMGLILHCGGASLASYCLPQDAGIGKWGKSLPGEVWGRGMDKPSCLFLVLDTGLGSLWLMLI